jgi:leucyl-tRNA synthetase
MRDICPIILPTEDGFPPLGNAAVWAWDSVNSKVLSSFGGVGDETIFLELSPGWAEVRLLDMDAHNETEFAKMR